MAQIYKKIILPLIFAVAFFLFPADAAFAQEANRTWCAARVLFQDKVLQRVYDAFIQDSWPSWYAHSGRELGAFVSTCDQPHRLVIGLSEVSDPLPNFYYSAFLYMHISPTGHVPRKEASEIVILGKQTPDVLLQVASMPRVAEYLTKMYPTRGIVVANAPKLSGEPIPEGFSGLTFDLFQSYIPSAQDEVKTYLAYDWQNGTLWYRLPLDKKWEEFPEVDNVTVQYTQAAAAISEGCTVRFTENDFIFGKLSIQSQAQFILTSTLPDCPPEFEVTMNLEELAALAHKETTTQPVDKRPLTATFEGTPIESPLHPFFRDFIVSVPVSHTILTADLLTVPQGLLTVGRLHSILFQHFLNILALMLFAVGILLFALVLYARLIYPSSLLAPTVSSKKSLQKTDASVDHHSASSSS